MTFSLILGGTFGVMFGLARENVAILVIGSVLGTFTLIAFMCTGCRNPGIVARRQFRLDADEIYDERAMTFRPVDAIFDHETGTIIREMDHFCPWTGTIIARGNMLAFQLFTSSLCVLILFIVAVVIWGLADIARKNGNS